MSSSYQDRQEEELQVLESIFGDALEDLRKKVAWKIARPLDLRLSLKPQQSMGGEGQVYAQVDLIVKCPPNYPDEAPTLSLHNSRGLSHQQVKELNTLLDQVAAKNVGEVMIWQLAEAGQEYLHQNNRPPPQSFYEQMISNKREQQERDEQTARQREEQKRQHIELEVNRRQEALRLENRRRKEDQKIMEPVVTSTPVIHQGSSGLPGVRLSPAMVIPRSVSPVTPVLPLGPPPSKAVLVPSRRRRSSTPKRSSQSEGEDLSGSPVCRNHFPGMASITFNNNKADSRVINRGKCLGDSSSGRVMYVGMDTCTGELTAVAEWGLKWRNLTKKMPAQDKGEDKEGAHYLKQVANIEEDFKRMSFVRHANLIRYLAFKHQYDPGRITVTVLMEYCGGSSLSMYTQGGAQTTTQHSLLPLATLRSYLTDIIEALHYLHTNNIVHRHMRASSVLVDSTGRVRLGDYGIDKRLTDLYETVERARPGVHFSTQPTQPMVLGRGGRNGDIYQLGLMLLTLLLGRPIKDVIPDIPSSIPAVVRDFLSKCLLKDERLRWSASQLREHKFLKLSVSELHVSTAVPHTHSQDDDLEVSKEEIEDQREAETVYLSSLVASGQSRLASEFELLKALGKGGFGDVLKVKNKLDGRFYAIKRIPLNPQSKMFNKKMTREVKLLSRLSHDNVVRYYCSWIEVSDSPILSDSSSATTASTKPSEARLPPSKRAPHIVRSIPLTRTPVLPKSANSSFDPAITDIEQLVPRAGEESVEWLTSFNHGVDTIFDSSADEDDDDDYDEEEDVFGLSFLPKDTKAEESEEECSESVVFGTDTPDHDTQSCTQSITGPQHADTQGAAEVEDLTMKILYIQMEYCEKSTLRSCIDAGLSGDMNRVWRLFREMIEGLVHIHSQGMIHRDLKPVNIFLDSLDHVKIGDFGLATTDILVKVSSQQMDLTLPSPQDGLNLSHSSGGDGNLTGKVGTALYVSPEVMEGGKVQYDQKVDIYSLGIIFFEMCYKCLPTGMERVKVLSNLRTPHIVMPEDFLLNPELLTQTELIKWLLQHDPKERPTSKELLASDLLPAPMMHDTELGEILRNTVNDPQSSHHRQLMTYIFNQRVLDSDDLLYDQNNFEVSQRRMLLQHQTAHSLTQLMTNHGAVHVSLPSLMPKSPVYHGQDQLVQLMDHRGGLVTMPLDLRVPFARYVARNNIHQLKRFAIEKVVREKKSQYHVHPRELTECAFDIITDSKSLMPDAEVVSIVQEIINIFPALQSRKYYIHMNHMSVLRAVLLHCGVPLSLHTQALSLLAEHSQNKKSRHDLQPETPRGVLESSLKVKVTDQLQSLLDKRCPLREITAVLKCITKTNGPASSLAKSGLHDLDLIVSYASSLGVRLDMWVCPGLVFKPLQYSALVFQVMCDVKKKKKRKEVTEVLAAGGRYDHLISQFVFPSQPNLPHSGGVGVSVNFDKLVSVAEEGQQAAQLSPCDVVVCAVGHKLMVSERLRVARELWAAGLRADILYDSTDDFDQLQDSCRHRGVSHVVMLKDGDASQVKVKSFDKDRVTEHKVEMHKLVEHLQKKNNEKSETSETPFSRDLRSSIKDNHGYGDCGNTVASSSSSSASFNYNIVFVPQEKGSKNTLVTSHYRRRHEALIAGKVSSQLPWLPEKNLEVLALDTSTVCIKAIQAYTEVGDEAAFEASIGVVMEKQPKLRKYLVGVFDMIHDLKFKKKCNFVVLYSTKEETLRLLA